MAQEAAGDEVQAVEWCIIVDAYGCEHDGILVECLQQHGLRILERQQLQCNRTSARRLLQSMCFVAPKADNSPAKSSLKSGARSRKKPAGTAAAGVDLSSVALPRVRPSDVACLTQAPCVALTIGPVQPDAGSAAPSPRGKGGKGGAKATAPLYPSLAALASAMPAVVGALPSAAAASSKSSTPRSAKSAKSAASAGGALRGDIAEAVRQVYPPSDEEEGGVPSRPASAASWTTGGAPSLPPPVSTAPSEDGGARDAAAPPPPMLPPPPLGAVHVYAPFTEDALVRTQAVVARLAQAAAAAAELAATKASRGKTAFVPEGPLFDFVFPAHVQHPKSAARLFAVGMFGPLDEDSGLLRGGVGGRRVLSDYELHALLDELADEDALAVCVPRELARGLQPEQKAEVLRSVRDIVPELPRVSPSQVSALLRGVPRDDQGRLSFADLQNAIVRARSQRVASLKRMYPALAAARGGAAPLQGAPKAGGRGALAPRFTARDVTTATLRETAAREGGFGATGGPLALSVAMDGVVPKGVKGGQGTAAGQRTQHTAASAPRGGRLAASMGRTPAARAGAAAGEGPASPLRRAGGFTLGGGGLRTGEETDASFLDVRLKRGDNARRRKAEQLLQRNSHKVVALGSANSAALAANALLLRQEPPPDMPSFDAAVALKGAGTGSYVHAPFSNVLAKRLVQR